MTTITIVFDTEDVSEESLSNYADALIDRGLISAGVVSKILINNKKYMDRKDIIKHQKLFNRLKTGE